MVSYLLLLASIWSVTFASCPAGTDYDSSSNRCYKYVTDHVAYLIAEQNCIDIGGHLVSIHNGLENVLISEQAQATVGMTGLNFWIGANRLMSNNWTWLDGTNFSYSSWSPSPPTGNNPCATVKADTGAWSAVSCGNSQPYVCAVNFNGPTTLPPPTPKPTLSCDAGWTLFAATKSCYKVLYNAKWDDAETSCTSSNAHLTSIHSDAENTFVADLSATGETQHFDSQVWIGVHRTGHKESTFYNVDGTPYDYHHWAPGQPDNTHDKEDCVELYSDPEKGKENSHYGWNDQSCDTQNRAYVCKKPANYS